jgi:hypothetical protein
MAAPASTRNKCAGARSDQSGYGGAAAAAGQSADNSATGAAPPSAPRAVRAAAGLAHIVEAITIDTRTSVIQRIISLTPIVSFPSVQ